MNLTFIVVLLCFGGYVFADEEEVEKNRVLRTIPKLEKTFKISVDIKPFALVNGWGSIIRLTNTNHNSGNIGDRIVALFFGPGSTRIEFSNGINLGGVYELPVFKSTNLKYEQTKDDAGRYHVFIRLNGIQVYHNVLDIAHTYTNVRVYAGDAFYDPAKAFISNFDFETPAEYTGNNGGYTPWSMWTSCTMSCDGGHQIRERMCTNPLPSYNGTNCSMLGEPIQRKKCKTPVCDHKAERNKLIRFIPTMKKTFMISFDINPVDIVYGWTSIIRFTNTNGDNRNVGDRIAGFFFKPGSTILEFHNGFFAVNHYIPVGAFTNVKVKHTAQNGTYIRSLSINDYEIGTSSILHPQTYDNVRVYAGDNFYNPANVIIKNFSFENIY